MTDPKKVGEEIEEEYEGPVMTIIETSFELIQSSRGAWDILEKEICRPAAIQKLQEERV